MVKIMLRSSTEKTRHCIYNTAKQASIDGHKRLTNGVGAVEGNHHWFPTTSNEATSGGRPIWPATSRIPSGERIYAPATSGDAQTRKKRCCDSVFYCHDNAYLLSHNTTCIWIHLSILAHIAKIKLLLRVHTRFNCRFNHHKACLSLIM